MGSDLNANLSRSYFKCSRNQRLETCWWTHRPHKHGDLCTYACDRDYWRTRVGALKQSRITRVTIGEHHKEGATVSCIISSWMCSHRLCSRQSFDEVDVYLHAPRHRHTITPDQHTHELAIICEDAQVWCVSVVVRALTSSKCSLQWVGKTKTLDDYTQTNRPQLQLQTR